jgi:hypothetical protein
MPDDPKRWIEAAERARARGDAVAAVRDLERARALRGQQLGVGSTAPDDSTLAYISLTPGAAPLPSRTTPKVLVTAAGSGDAPSSASPVYAGADLGQDTPDQLATPPALRPGGRPTSLSPSAVARPSATPYVETRPANAAPSADALNARQLQSTSAASASQLVPAGDAPVYPSYVPPVPTPVLAQGQRYQPQLQENLPRYRPAPSAPMSQGGNLALADMETSEQGLAGFGAAGAAANSGDPDPMLREIDRNIVALRDSLSPAVQAGYGFRWNSGQKGLSRLTEETIPLEAVYTPGESGQIKVTVTRSSLTSGTFNSSDLGLQRFGTIALGLSKPFVVGSTYFPSVYSGTRPGRQAADGVGLNVQYSDDLFRLDVGSTPIGFKIPNVVGGVEVAPRLTDQLRLRVGASRRAMTQTVLSYAGTTDPRTGITWGGVVEDRGSVALEYGDGDFASYVIGGGGQLTGRHVADNTEYGVSGGASYPAWRGETDEIRVGLDLTYESYAKNLGNFTLGQGGYFSPQRYLSALVPVTYRGKVGDDFTYETTAALGVQSFAQKSSNYFPADPGLQAQLNAMLPVGGLVSSYPGTHVSGLAGNIRGKFDYRVSTNLRVGGQVAYQHSGDYDEAVASVFARYIFNGPDR